MDRHGLAVVVENDDLKEPASAVGTDVEVTVGPADYADGIVDCVLDVLVGNTVLTGVVRDLHLRKLPCLSRLRKLPCLSRLRKLPCERRLVLPALMGLASAGDGAEFASHG
ncbi:hypothetical protein [Candidatus Mycobacterium methanotrophicum]|uniref:hypothetical protein n=1 Tax=Candidatus Mycobacterium methanotrophicum TaxID=2943498 RepID=UPI001C560F62